MMKMRMALAGLVLGALAARAADAPQENDPAVSQTMASLATVGFDDAARQKLVSVNLRQTTGADFRTAVSLLGKLPALKQLTLKGTEFTDGDAASIQNMHAMENLNVMSTLMTDKGFANLRGMSKLTELDARDTKITDAALASIAGLPIARLSLGGTLGESPITDKGVAQLKQMPLEMLILNMTHVSDAGLEQLKGQKKLDYLAIIGTPVTGKGVANLPALKTLIADKSAFDDAGLAAMSAQCKLIEELSLNNTKITDAGLLNLKEMRKLENLTILGTKVTPAGVAQLKRFLPQCNITLE